MKNFLLKFKYLLIGLGLALTTTAYAINVTVPQSTQKADVLVGNANGTYRILNVGANGQCLLASSTTASGLVWGACASGATGITTLNAQTGATQLFATTTSGTVFTISSSGDTHTFTFPASPTFTNLTYTGQGTFALASGTSLSLSGNLWVTGQTSLGNASSTALTVSGLTRLASTTITGTLNVTGNSTLATTSIPALSNLTSNGFVKTSGGTGTLSIDTATYLTGNQTITLSGDVSGSGETAITTAIGNDKVTEAMLKVVDTPTDEDILTYESTTGDFEWHTPAQLNLPTYAYASSAYVTVWNLTAGSNITITTSTVPTIAVSSTPTFTTLSTGQGQYELYAMDQDVLTTSNVTFAKGTFTNASTTNLTVNTDTYLKNLTSQNCLGTSASGLLQAGSCGGGSGNSAWTIGASKIYNATSTDSVLVGTTTPTTAKLFVQGSGSQLPLRVASSTGATLFTIDTYGSTTVANLGAGPVYSTAGGSLYTGTTPTGTASGTAGAIQFSNGSGGFNANDLFTWDNTNKRLGINSSTPIANLSVGGIAGNTNDIVRVASSSGKTFLNVAHNGVTGLGWESGSNGPVIQTQTNGQTYFRSLATPGTPDITAFIDTNTGLSWDGGDGFIFSAGGAEVARYNTTGHTLSGSMNFIMTSGTGKMGINTSSPITTFHLQGNGATIPFRISTSTGATLFEIGTNGSTTITTLASAGCVAATSAGSLYVTSCAGGAVTGTGTNGFGAAWTSATALTTGKLIDNGTVIGMNATSSTIGFNVQGTAGSNTIFNIASSTGTSLFSIPASQTITMATTTVTKLSVTVQATAPNGTAPVITGVGDYGVDTSNGGMFSFYANGRENVVATTTKAFFIQSPTASESHKTVPGYSFDVPVTITKVRCLITSDSNTPSWTFSLPHSTSLGTASANAMSSGQACTSTTTPQTITIGGDLTLAAGETIWATSSAVSNASSTTIFIDFKYDN